MSQVIKRLAKIEAVLQLDASSTALGTRNPQLGVALTWLTAEQRRELRTLLELELAGCLDVPLRKRLDEYEVWLDEMLAMPDLECRPPEPKDWIADMGKQIRASYEAQRVQRERVVDGSSA